MKYLFPVLMAVVIFVGLLLSTTPILMSYFFPTPKESLQKAKPEEAAIALKHWFNRADAEFTQVKAMRERLSDIGTNAYFTFETNPEVVTTFIRLKHLQQLELTDEVMQTLLLQPKIGWWQPQVLARETYFSGEDKGIMLHLIYNAQLQRGFLLVQQ